MQQENPVLHVDLKGAAVILGCTPATIYNLINNGSLIPVQDRPILFDRGEILRLALGVSKEYLLLTVPGLLRVLVGDCGAQSKEMADGFIFGVEHQDVKICMDEMPQDFVLGWKKARRFLKIAGNQLQLKEIKKVEYNEEFQQVEKDIAVKRQHHRDRIKSALQITLF